MTDITPMIDNSGNEYDIPTKELEQFKADMGTGVQRQYLYRTEDGQDFAIPENDAKAFLNDFPNARPVRRIQLLGGETEDIPSNEMSQFFQRYETDDRYKHDREYDAAVKAGEEARKEYAAAKRRSAEATARLRELEEKNQWMDDTIEFFKGVGRTFINPEKEYREVFGDDHIATRMIASGNDAANSIVAGVMKIPYDIQKVLGFVAGGRNTRVGNWLIDEAQKTEDWIDSKLPQHTKEKYMSDDEAEIANTIQNMTSTLFNFTLTAGVGGAVGATTKTAGGAVAGQRAANATIVAMDSSDAYIDTYDRAIARGANPKEANALANQAFIWNAIMEGTLINGGLNPMLNSANKLAATPTIDLTKHTFSGITRGLTVGTLRNYAAKTTGHVLSTAAIMGTDKAGKESIRQVADGEEVDFEKIAEAGKSGLVEGGVMGAVFGSAAGLTAAGEYRACHKAMKKKFGDMIIKNVETARGREMMAAANPKGTYDFLKARENGGVPSRKQADRMILPDTLSGKQRAEIADKFLKDGITPEKIKADMFDRIPKAKSVEPKAEPPKQALPPPASTPETPAEQPVPPVEPPKTAESTAGSAVVKPIKTGVSKTTPSGEAPPEAVLERSAQVAVQQKTATTPAEAPVEEAKTPAETPVVAENGTQITENGKETPKPAEETAPEQPVSTAPEAVPEAPAPQNAVEAPTSAPTETQPITPPEPVKAATDAHVTPGSASAAKDAPKDAVEPATPPEKAPEAPQSAPETATATETTPATAPDTDFSVTPQNTGKTVTEQKTASIARLDGLMQTAGELARKRKEANDTRNREALKQTAGLSDERAKLREEIATLNSEFAQSRKSIPPEQMDAAVKKYNNAVAKRNKRIQEIENEIAKIHNEATDNSPLGETTVDLGGGTRIRLEMSEPSIKKVRAAISKSMSSLRIEKKPTVEKVEKAMSSIAAKLDPNESRTRRISIVHREDGVMVATDGRMAFTYADDSIKGDNVIDYPNWRMVIPEDRSLTQSPLKIDLAHLHEKASRAAVCSRGNDELLERMPYMIVRPNGKKGATVDFIGHGRDGKAIFSTTDNPAGAIHVATVNPEFLLKTVKAAAAAGEKELTLKWENAQQPIMLAGEKCKAVIMPLRNTQTAHSDKPIDSVLGLKELYGSAGPAESAAKAPEVEARTGLGGRRTGEAGAVKGGSEKAGASGEVTAEKSFLPGGVIEARRSLESDNGVPPDGWRYFGSSEGNFAVKLPDEKTLREYIEKNFGPIEGEIEAGVKAGGEIYNVNEILLKMAGAKSEVKPMSETVAETQASDSVTPQKKLDTYREYAKSVVLREGATIADVQNALMNVPEDVRGVSEADVFFERLKSMIVKEFRADKHAIELDKKYQSTTDASERQSIEREFRKHQRQFVQNFLDNRKDDIIKAFDELELKPGDTVSNMAKREAGVPQETIGDIAAEVAADVDAAIAAEESGTDPSAVAHAPEKPAETVESPRGRGTGTLSRDNPVSRGKGTGKRKIVTPQTFLRRARELFPDVAFRHKGTVRIKKWSAGHFEPYYRLIRPKDMNSIGTVAHELGHDIEHLTRYDVLRLPAVKRDLSDLGHHLYGNDGPKPPSYIGEGFAEYVRGYICNAPNLSTVAPDLDDWFKGPFKAKHPGIVKKLDELRDMVQTMKEQSAAEAVGGFMRPSTESINRAWNKTLDFFSGENWNDSASIILRGMKKSGIDKIFRWQDDFKKLEASKSLCERRKLANMISDKVENNPYIFATITRGTASQRVMDMARYGTTNLLGNKKTGESLKDIFADFSVAERETWKKYAIAKHGIENYFKKGMNFGLPREVLEDVVSKYETPKFSLALQRYTDYSHRILHLGVESGLISQETYDKIVNDHPIYVRITRRYADDGAHTRQSGQAINRRTGGFDHILDPIDAALMDQEKFLRACFQAKTLQLIVRAGERAAMQNIISARENGGPDTTNTNPVDPAHNAVGAYWPVEVPNAQEAVKFSAAKLQKGLKDAAKDYSGRTGEDFIPLQEFIDDLATTQDAQGRVAQLTIFRDKPSYGKHNLVSVHVGGKLRTFELPDMKWANMLTDVYDKSDFNFLEKMFGLATAGIRLGATTVNPGFAVRNGIRDSLHSAVMSETGAIPGVSTLYGIGQQLLGSEAAELFRAMGGHMSDLVGITKEQKWNHGGKVALAQNPLQTIGAYSSLDWVLMKPVIKAFSDILSIPELGPRINEMSAVMAKCRKAGLSENACAILAMSHAKDISIDFQRAGRFMKHINHFIPFSNAMWRGTEQTIRNFGLLPSLPHQFEDSNPKRGAKTAIRGLAFITSWAVLLAMLEMSGDDKKKRAAFERSKEEKWNYAYVGDWRIPLPFEVGHIFGALPKAAIYEMNGDEGAIKECLETFGQALPVKYANPDTAIGSISMLTPWIGLLSNRDYRDRPIVPEHIMENAEKQDWYTQYTTELSKKIGSTVGASPAQLEYLLDSYTGGLYRRVALMAENIDDVSRLQEGRGFSMLDTLRARPQANRLIEDFYKFGVEGKRKFGSGNITLEEYGKLASQNPVKKQLTEKFDEMRAARADKSLPLAEQDRRVREISEEAYEIVRKFNAKDDYRKRGIASAADALTDREASDLDEKKKARLLELLKGVPKNEIVTSLIEYGSELVPIKIRGVETYHQRWSSQNINQRVMRLLMLLQD